MSQLPFLHVYCTCIYMYIKKTINEYFFFTKRPAYIVVKISLKHKLHIDVLKHFHVNFHRRKMDNI